jgi:hypothetical protein
VQYDLGNSKLEIQSYFLAPFKSLVHLFILIASMMFSLVNVFALCSFVALDNETPPLLTALVTTISTQMSLSIDHMSRLPSWWYLKLCTFHCIMFPKFIYSRLIVVLTTTVSTFKACSVGPILYRTPTFLYWMSIILASAGMLYVELILQLGKPHKQAHTSDVPLCLLYRYDMAPPLPAYYMAMSGVMLSNSFIG